MRIFYYLFFFQNLQGNVLVERPPIPVSNLMSQASSGNSIKSHTMHPSSFKDSSMIGNSSHNHHHHRHKRHHSNGRVKKDYGNTADRFSRTATVLRHSGLLKLTLQIAQLIKTNEDLQKEIDDLQREAMEFSQNLKIQIQQKLSEQNGSSSFQYGGNG